MGAVGPCNDLSAAVDEGRARGNPSSKVKLLNLLNMQKPERSLHTFTIWTVEVTKRNHRYFKTVTLEVKIC